MKKKISELSDAGNTLSSDDLLVVVDKDTNTTGKATIDSVVRAGTPIFMKMSTNKTRGYLIGEDNKPPVDTDAQFFSSEDGVGEGYFDFQCIAFFMGAPPVVYVESNGAVCHSLHKIYKINFMERPEGVPILTGVCCGIGSASSIEEIKSVIIPQSSEYEPMFFYENDPELSPVINGYFVEINSIVYLDSSNPIKLRWCSVVDGLETNLKSASLQITKLIIK